MKNRAMPPMICCTIGTAASALAFESYFAIPTASSLGLHNHDGLYAGNDGPQTQH